MEVTLVVTRPFQHYSVGDQIVVPADITSVLASEHAHSVVAVKTPPKAVQE